MSAFLAVGSLDSQLKFLDYKLTWYFAKLKLIMSLGPHQVCLFFEDNLESSNSLEFIPFGSSLLSSLTWGETIRYIHVTVFVTNTE